ncbi:hypothetical protein BJX99DRAFT_242584, partial [Aspergillus californicus]
MGHRTLRVLARPQSSALAAALYNAENLHCVRHSALVLSGNAMKCCSSHGHELGGELSQDNGSTGQIFLRNHSLNLN